MNTRFTAPGDHPVQRTPPVDSPPRALAFSSPDLPVHVFDHPGQLHLDGPAIVINPTGSPVPLHPAGLLDRLGPMSAGRYQSVGLRNAEPVVVVGLDRLGRTADAALRPGWHALADLPGMEGVAGARDLPLFRSPRDRVATITARPDELSPGLPPEAPQLWGVFMNLWFAPAGTHCLIHNSHPFLEYHVQIAGHGAMQKFRHNDWSSLYEEQVLAPGAQHGIYPVRPAGDGTYRYPWHQYLARTDCIWLAVELIPEGPAPRPASAEFAGACCAFHAHD